MTSEDRAPRIPHRTLAAIALAVALVSANAAQAEEITGTPRVIDGDTIEIDGRKIRLRGIDAPEREQTCLSGKGVKYACGLQSIRYLTGLLRRQKVTCKGDIRDAEGLLLATCTIGWLNLNEQIVIDGWGMADQSRDPAYVRGELAAKARREGLWRGSFEAPWEWRANNPGQGQ